MMLADCFFQKFQFRKFWSVFLPLDLPAAQGTLHVSDDILCAHRSDNGDDHAARTIIVTMEPRQVITFDLLDRLGVTIFWPAIRMAFEQYRIEEHGSHIRRILRADGETGQ